MNVNLAIEKIRALLKSEGVGIHEKEKALKSISETCLPTKLTSIYLNYIYESMRNNPWINTKSYQISKLM